MKTKSRIVSINNKKENKSIGSKIAEVLACICMAIPTVMIVMALFIDYTEAEKNFMLVLMFSSIVFIFISDPKEFIEMIIMTTRTDDDAFYDDEYEEYWIDEIQAYFDPFSEKFFYYDEDTEEYYYFNDQEQFEEFKKTLL